MFEAIPYKREMIRKIVHIALSLTVFSLLIWNPQTIKILFLILTVIYILIDYLRLKIAPLGLLYKRLFGLMVRNEEASRLSGASYAFIGASVTILLFDPITAISAILILGMSDAMAAIIGRRFGATRMGQKSLEGSFTFFLVTFLILYFYTGLIVPFSIGISFICTILELIMPRRLNDNLVIPITAGLLITLL